MDWIKLVKEKLPRLLADLTSGEFLSRDRLGDCPQRGVYVFYAGEEGNEEPIYVGRSNNMKERIQTHSRASSSQNSAPLAFNMARDAREEWKSSKLSRNKLCEIKEFEEVFSKKKEEVGGLKIRYIEISDDISQAFFEIYASVELGSINKYNDWSTH